MSWNCLHFCFNLAFNFNLRRYTKGRRVPRDSASPEDGGRGGFLGSPRTTFTEYDWQGLTLVPISAQLELVRPPYNPL